MTSPPSSTGGTSCPCLNKTAELASLTERACTTPSGEPGIILTLDNGACAPLHYGSSVCQPHDLVYDPNCDVSLATNSNFPHYCFQSWCYVDVASCAKTTNAVYRSSFFPANSGAELFYSYDTCNSTTEDWLSVLERDSVGAVEIKANVPAYQKPMLYKRDGDGVILATPGEEYYNNSVPYEGVYIDYVSDLVRISNGDIQDISYTYKSMGSVAMHPSSHYTAAVQDIENGLADMSVGPFWITGQRLKMSAFTVPLIYDKTVLVIPKPRNKNSLSYQTSKVLAPFTAGLWGVVILVIVCTSLLSVWFAKGSSVKRPLRRRPKPSFRQELGVWSRLSLDSILEKGLFFFSGGVGQDEGSSLPNKLLLFGFGFFTLISVSAYVANLASFLTRPPREYVSTMEDAVANNLKICGHPALARELKSKWPYARFVLSDTVNNFHGVFEDYRAGKCDAMAIGREDTMVDLDLLNSFCDEGLVYTNSLVIENPIAFPVRPKLASGLSYWILQGDKYFGVSLTNSIKNYATANHRQPKCNVEFSPNDVGGDDYAQIMPSNMFFPIVFWLTCAICAAILQLIHQWQRKIGKESFSLIGRVSSLDLFKTIDCGDSTFLQTERIDDTAESCASRRSVSKTPCNHRNIDSKRGFAYFEQESGNARRRSVEFLSATDEVEDDPQLQADEPFDLGSEDCDKRFRLEEDGLDCRIRHSLNHQAVVDFLHCCLQLKNTRNR
mmetsp:Transcript_12799/g.25708  ORF Transcript_12799/g.25708 Transcript_12799/m.25708 type:complete len:724 (-) Transcript_12799:683-2854(-)